MFFSCCMKPPAAKEKGAAAPPVAQSDSEEHVASTKSDQIDHELAEMKLKSMLNFKILLLGAGESGKSTIMKQIKLIHKIRMTPQELKLYVSALKRNAAQCMQVFIKQAHEAGHVFEGPDLTAKVKLIEEYDINDEEEFTLEIVDAIEFLWKQDIIQATYERRSEYWVLDSANFFIENLSRFVQDDYEPTDEDIVMSRVMTTGILSADVPVPPVSFTVVDVGGQRNERRKWIHCFSDVHGVVFCVNLAGYNSVLFEDSSMNRMVESLNLFRQTVNNPIFTDCNFFVVFNKKDLFEKMIRDKPITACELFADYNGTGDVHDSLNFITNKFRDQVSSGDVSRVQFFHIAARVKKDVKTTWEESVKIIQDKHRKQIQAAIDELKK